MGIAGVADEFPLANVAANFNSSFVCDRVEQWYYGTIFPSAPPFFESCSDGFDGFGGHRYYAYRSATFELDPPVTYENPGGFFSTYYFGRVILIPSAGMPPDANGDNCTPWFRLMLQVGLEDNDDCRYWLWVAAVYPQTATGNDIAGDCTALDRATYSDNNQTYPREDIQKDIVFQVSAL